ncbi:HD domain-containing protein [Ferrovibrio xuzhouensis]|uniref:HD family hydrolase n=1 Tax=Ferrovibrio xuzhouensis TaxID=1576914 RepID=A0ABV7VK62_9PROT
MNQQPPDLPAMERLHQQIGFILEIDKLKLIIRRTLLIDQSRRENDAEHSWHLAMMALVLAEYAEPGVDIGRVIHMLLLHDLVEIDAGDAFFYDAAAEADKAAREQQAAERLFGLLPDGQGEGLRALWEEFEARETADARFARALDRVQPMLHNFHTEGGTWKEYGVTLDQVRSRRALIADASPQLWAYVDGLLVEAVRRGFLAEKR